MEGDGEGKERENFNSNDYATLVSLYTYCAHLNTVPASIAYTLNSSISNKIHTSY